jgi:hypothetical protein
MRTAFRRRRLDQKRWLNQTIQDLNTGLPDVLPFPTPGTAAKVPNSVPGLAPPAPLRYRKSIRDTVPSPLDTQESNP